MRPTKHEEPLLPPWVMRIALSLGPIAGFAAVWYLLEGVLRLPTKIWLPAVLVLGTAGFVYFTGRFYRPFYANREGKCTAIGAKQREGCRRFLPGARLGGGCGRLREDGKCRYVR